MASSDMSAMPRAASSAPGGEEGGGRRQRGPTMGHVKNKAPAPMQITAEQILRGAREMQEQEGGLKAPDQKITDPEELNEYRMAKRREYEDVLRRNRTSTGAWLKYAKWEESQEELERVRSIYERALDVDYRNATVWLKYAEMEMRHRSINRARNIWDRAVSLLPRTDQFWFKYAFMEEMMGNVTGCRGVFERWMGWQPDSQAWQAYIKFEQRCGELEQCAKLYERFVEAHPTTRAWIRYAKFEDKRGETAKGRRVFERAMEALGEDANEEVFFLAFVRFEERAKEHERARVIYKYALQNISKADAVELYKSYASFEKMHGDRAGVEDVIVEKKRLAYEADVAKNPQNYDSWFDYARMEEAGGSVDAVREVYERAIGNLPPAQKKTFWRRYIYLWINYALFEELQADDAGRAREVYQACKNVIPHAEFSFSKVWLYFAQFEIRQKNLGAARKILGEALGRAPKSKLFKGYITLELQLGNIDRCRTIYGKWLENDPTNVLAFADYADMERSLGELERARAIFELAVGQQELDMPEQLWKSYIDFEIGEEAYDHARALYRRLLERTKHVKVWVSMAQFETAVSEIANARAIFDEANLFFKGNDELEVKQERLVLLETWQDFEEGFGDAAQQALPTELMPRRVKKRRPIAGLENAAESDASGWQEYTDLIYPDEQKQAGGLKILEMARAWKKQKATDEPE